MTPVSPETEAVLRDAMGRLLTGRPIRTDGRLTVTNLAAEAGVARATANRATSVLEVFKTGVEKSTAARNAAKPLRGRLRILQRKLAEIKKGERQDIVALNVANDVLAQRVQAMALHMEEQGRIIAALQRELRTMPGAKIVPLRPETTDKTGKTVSPT
jgi:hypothetical protein